MTHTKKPAVSLLQGLHITAADKRNIVEGIDWLRQDFAASVAAMPAVTPDYGSIWIGRGTSAKRYSIAPTGEGNTYSVVIRESYRADSGQMRQRDRTVTVQIANLDPLYLPAAEGSAP